MPIVQFILFEIDMSSLPHFLNSIQGSFNFIIMQVRTPLNDNTDSFV